MLRFRKLLDNPRHIGTAAGWYSQCCSLLGPLLVIPYIMRDMGAEKAGLWFSLQSTMALLLIVDFGLGATMSRQIAFTYRFDRQTRMPASDFIASLAGLEGVKTLIYSARHIYSWILATVAILGVGFHELVRPFSAVGESLASTSRWTYYMLLAASLFLIVSKLWLAVLEGMGLLYRGRLIVGTHQLLLLIFNLLALRLKMGIEGLAFATLLASILQWIVVKHSARDAVVGWQVGGTKDADPKLLRRQLWKVSIPFGTVLVGAFLVGTAQIPLAAAVLGAAAVPPIYIAFKFSQALNAVAFQYVSAQLPAFTHEIASQKWNRAKRIAVETMTATIIFHVVSGIGIIIVSPIIVDVWVGPAKYISGGVLALFALNHTLTSIAGVPAQFVIAAGRNPFAVSTLLHGLLSMFGILLLSPHVGLIAVPLSALSALILTNLWVNLKYGRHLWHELSHLSATRLQST